jgi:hypothetical protein
MPRLVALAFIISYSAVCSTADTLSTFVLSSTQPSSTSCAQPPSQTSFTTAAGNIYEYFVINNMRAGDNVSVRWINPGSQVVMTTNWTHPLSSAGNYCWTGAYLTQSQYMYSLGLWHVQVDVDGQYLGQTTFTVTPSWQSMTQQQRNQAIINAGLNGHSVSGVPPIALYNIGLECKPWVQWVVSNASNNWVSLPATAPDNYQWHPGAHVVQMSSTLPSLQPGWILQLQRANNAGPHTAIVLSASTAGIYLFDSNWVDWPQIQNEVGIHFMTWPQFNSAFTQYSVYEIAW